MQIMMLMITCFRSREDLVKFLKQLKFNDGLFKSLWNSTNQSDLYGTNQDKLQWFSYNKTNGIQFI
jgi:hypothetical protein